MRKLILIALFMLVALSKAMADTNTMTGIKVIPLPDERVRVDFCFTSPLKNLPASFITQKPPRLVLDFIQTKMVINEKDKSRKIEIGSLTNYNIVAVGDRVRAILDLTDSISYSGQIAGNTYSLTLSGKSHQIFQQRREIFVSNRPVNARHGITNLDFRGTGAEGGRVIIDVTDASIPIDVTQTGKEVVVNFMSTQIPPRLIKRFDVADFQSPAQLLSLQQDGKNARLTIISKGDYGHYAYQVNKQFIVEIYPLSAEEAKQAKLKKMVFTGKRISLNFQNIQIRAVLQLLAEFTGINIVVSDQVQGSITLRLNDIPWDQALDIILKTNALDKRKTGNVLLIDKASNLLEQEKMRSRLSRLLPILPLCALN